MVRFATPWLVRGSLPRSEYQIERRCKWPPMEARKRDSYRVKLLSSTLLILRPLLR